MRATIIKHNSLTSKNRKGRMPLMIQGDVWERLHNFKCIGSSVLGSGEIETDIT